jgi:hypothetical protein
MALLFPLLPGHPLAPLSGPPVDALSLAVLGLVAVLFFGWTPHRRVPSDRYLLGALAVLCLAKLGTHAASLDYGLRADYFTGAPDGTISTVRERSLDQPRLDATRLDRALGFDFRNIPVYFWNDLRFNFYGAEARKRSGLPLHVEWRGYLFAPEPGRYTFRLRSEGPAVLTIGAARLSLDALGEQSTGVILNQGMHPITAENLRPENAPVEFEAAWDRDPDFQVLAAPFLLPAKTTPDRWAMAQWAQVIASRLVALYGVVLIALAARLIWEWWSRARIGAEAFPERRQRRGAHLVALRHVTAAEMERPLLALLGSCASSR